MGQKVNPVGIRLGITRDWTSRWYANKRNFPSYVLQDWQVRDFLKNLPKDKMVQVGVLDVRSNAIESPATIAARIKKVIAAVPPDRVVLSTDCGMKPLARMVAKMKLHSLGEGARMVRKEVAGV